MKTNLDEINRNIYDIKNKDEYDFKIQKGLTKEIIEESPVAAEWILQYTPDARSNTLCSHSGIVSSKIQISFSIDARLEQPRNNRIK